MSGSLFFSSMLNELKAKVTKHQNGADLKITIHLSAIQHHLLSSQVVDCFEGYQW